MPYSFCELSHTCWLSRAVESKAKKAEPKLSECSLKMIRIFGTPLDIVALTEMQKCGVCNIQFPYKKAEPLLTLPLKISLYRGIHRRFALKAHNPDQDHLEGKV